MSDDMGLPLHVRQQVRKEQDPAMTMDGGAIKVVFYSWKTCQP